MVMKLRSTLLAATVLALPMAARAQMLSTPSLNGFYVGAGVGANYLQDEKIQIPPAPGNSGFFNTGGTNTGLSLRSEWGPIGLGYLGYELGNGLSLQLEGQIRNNKFNQLRGFPASAGGNEEKYGPMAALIFDLSPYIPYAAPYIGVGAGYQWDKLSNLRVTSTTGATLLTSNDRRGAFAYEAILGTVVPLGYTGLALTLEYRFMGQLARDFDVGVSPAVAGAAPVTGKIRLANEFNHAVLVGFRYTFGVTPPAPPPAPAPVAAPAPAPARSYLVFFDWDRATLTDRARMIIREAAENSRRVQYTQIEVNGYTDTSGRPSYNQRLSVRRAENVAAELVRDGVPRNAISIQGFGETHLLVPTGPGVREPQNRRVEIIIR
jgi:opacity protein-like surface antigen